MSQVTRPKPTRMTVCDLCGKEIAFVAASRAVRALKEKP